LAGNGILGSVPALLKSTFLRAGRRRTEQASTCVFLGGEATPRLACDFVISVDEKTSVQARRRKQPTLPAAADRPMRVEHEYFREGAWTYLAAWDVHRAKLFGLCEKKSGIAPTDRLMSEVMSQEPYKSRETAKNTSP
jgi:hypothetical protein